jgi:hypothetical protein
MTASGMLDQGISDDGVHPSVLRGDAAADFTAAGLRYGYNQRNLTALQILSVIRRRVLGSS